MNLLGSDKKRMISGFMLIFLAFLVFLSLATHQPSDLGLLDDTITYEDYYFVPVENSLGLAGVYTSHTMLWSIGRSAFLLPLIALLFGWKLLWAYENKRLLIKMLQAFGFVFALGTLLFLFKLDNANIGVTLTNSLSGKLGLTISGILKTLIGKTGAFALLSAIMLFILFAVIPFKPGNIREKIISLQEFFKGLSLQVFAAVKNLVSSIPELFTREVDEDEDLDDEDVEENEEIPDDTEDEEEEANSADLFPEHKVNKTRQKKTKRTLKVVTPKRKKNKNGFVLPSLTFLQEPQVSSAKVSEKELQANADNLVETLKTFGVEIVAGSAEIYPGPIITRYEFKPAPGVKINQIVNLSDDLALAMKASRIRIIAPVPGKSAIGVEMPNLYPETVYMRDILSSKEYQNGNQILPLALGKTSDGKPLVADLSKMPHLLIAGATGTGKSVCLNAIITSLIYRYSPQELRLILVDPKILELSIYSDIPYLARPVVHNARMVESVLATAVSEMEERYRKLAKLSTRSLADYNKKAPEEDRLPFLVIIIDELADIMMSKHSAKTELLITRLAQMARAVGIHLILATQRPSVDVITGTIKANFSSRLAFQVATRIDSRTVLDGIGAEKLLGNGDMLYQPAGAPQPLRVHGCWITSEETELIVDSLKEQKEFCQPLDSFTKEKEKKVQEQVREDVLLPEAIEMVIRHKQGSVSLLQRRLAIGYQRAARLMDQLEAKGIVGPYDGSRAREVLVDDSYLEELNNEA